MSDVNTGKKNFSTLIRTSVVIGLIVFLGVVGFLAFSLAAPPSTTQNTGNQPTLNRDLVPQTEKFVVTQTSPGSKDATLIFTTPNVPDGYYVEYKVADNSSRTVTTGKILKPGTTTTQIVLKNGSTSLTISSRVVSDTDYSPWVVTGTSNSFTVNSDMTTQRTVEEAFYETDWAYKKDTSPEALAEAIQVAFPGTITGVEPNFTVQQDGDQCYWGNSATVLAGEIVRPLPDLGSSTPGLKLLAGVSQQNEKQYTINYYWCEPAQQ